MSLTVRALLVGASVPGGLAYRSLPDWLRGFGNREWVLIVTKQREWKITKIRANCEWSCEVEWNQWLFTMDIRAQTAGEFTRLKGQRSWSSQLKPGGWVMGNSSIPVKHNWLQKPHEDCYMYTVPFCGMKEKASDEMTVSPTKRLSDIFLKTSLQPLTALLCTILRE